MVIDRVSLCEYFSNGAMGPGKLDSTYSKKSKTSNRNAAEPEAWIRTMDSIIHLGSTMRSTVVRILLDIG